LLEHTFLGAVAGSAAEEGLPVQLAGHKFEMQVDEGGQFAQLGGGKRVGRHQGGLRVLRLQVVDDDLALAQRLAVAPTRPRLSSQG